MIKHGPPFLQTCLATCFLPLCIVNARQWRLVPAAELEAQPTRRRAFCMVTLACASRPWRHGSFMATNNFQATSPLQKGLSTWPI